jgi:poly-gamma-glutamate biosynthesis protein PgsC/CapC
MLQQAMTLSILLSFVSSELLGLLCGGMVSAGYLAFHLETPLRVAATLVMALAVYGITLLAGRVVILYGRRRFMLCIIMGLLLTWLYEKNAYLVSGISQDLRIIGYVVPGLIANDMCKQGVVRTVLMVLVCTVLIRLILTAGVAL